MENLIKEHMKYKWFYTSSKKLVVGGKSAEQNDEILKSIKKSNQDFFVMHTAEPGSPFSIILSDIDNVKKSDLEEAAVFTACFSKAWKSGKKKAVVDIFLASRLFKTSGMKTGTWGVKEKLSSKKVNLGLALIIQDNILRAAPISAAKKPLLIITPGKINKIRLLSKIKEKLNNKFSDEEILSALPAGGLEIK